MEKKFENSLPPKEGRAEKIRELREISSDILRLINERLSRDKSKAAELIDRYQELIIGFKEKLKNKYGRDFENYRLYHLLIGSTPDEKKIIGFDFPDDEYSVEKFIKNLKNELGLEESD